MKGSYQIRVENARVQFKLKLTRSLTLIRGMSATGKSTLISLLSEHQQNGPASGVTLSSPRPCVVPSLRTWRQDIEAVSESFVFFDEGSDFVRTEEFAHAQRMYARIPSIENPQTVIVEDSNAGYEFFSALCAKAGIECISAHGKGNVLARLRECASERVLVVADGAAFGPQMNAVLELARRKGAGLFLPESFEWLILKSGLVRDAEVPKVLEDPAAYVESKSYFSWERFFNALLVDKTKGTYLQYSKSSLNSAYLGDRESHAIEKELGQTGITPMDADAAAKDH